MSAEPLVSRRLGLLDVKEVMLRSGDFDQVDRYPAVGGEPCERLALSVEIVVVTPGVANVDCQFARPEVCRGEQVCRIVTLYLGRDFSPVP